MEVLAEVWQLLTDQYPVAGLTVVAFLAFALLIWGVRATAYWMR